MARADTLDAPAAPSEARQRVGRGPVFLADARRAARVPVPIDGQWLFLGKDGAARQRLAERLGADAEYPLDGQLHRIADALRQPFLDFVARVGACQTDPVTWWSSSFSWKVWTDSDLFLLVCYVELARQLAASDRGGALLLACDDPWLLAQLIDALGAQPHVRVLSRPTLWRARLQLLARGAALRAWWLGKVVAWFWWRQRRVWRGVHHREPTQPTVGIYSVPMARCLAGADGWRDPFLPGLDAILRELGYDVVRFSPPHCAGFETELARRQDYFHPLILEATPAAVWRALTAWWHARWPDSLTVGDLRVDHLARREWWREAGRSSLCFLRLFYETVRRLIARGAWRWIVFPYENQPREKLMTLAAYEVGLRTVGIQHSTVARHFLSFFAGQGERMPYPDVICPAGPYPAAELVRGGTPEDRLRRCGSLRYGHLAPEAERRALPPAPRMEIFVVVPFDVDTARLLFSVLGQQFPTGGAEDGVRFHVKLHPSEEALTIADVPIPCVEERDFQDAVRRCGLLIYAGSTVGPEMMALGRAVLRFRPELLLDVDQSEMYGEQIPSANERTLREVLLRLVRDDTPMRPAALDPSMAPFAPFDRTALEAVFGPAAAR